MNIEEIKVLLNNSHINSWPKIYKDNHEVHDYLFSLYNIEPHTDKEIYELFYLVMHDLKTRPLAFCGKPAKFGKFGKGYKSYCNDYDRSLKGKSCAICHEHIYNERNKKAKKTNLEKYGTEISQQNELIKEKVKQTNLKKYGVESHNSNLYIKEKKKKVFNDRYGVDNPSQLSEVKDKVKKTNLEKYGESSYLKTLKIKEDMLPYRYETILKLCNEQCVPNFTKEFLLNKTPLYHYEFKCNYCGNIFLSTYNPRISKCKCQKLSGISESEKELAEYIKSLIPDVEIIENNRTIISPKELDIYIPSLNIAFEYNGMYWHSTNFKEEYSHQEKVLLCKEQGIKLIHIFEDEWYNVNELIKQRIKSLLGISERIYARKCILQEVSKLEKDNFLNTYHIQGTCNSSINLGLYYNDKLVSLMTFGKSRFDKSIQYELIRYCSNGTVVGGASKLLKYFESTYHPESLISYADMNWSSGNLYDKLNFEYCGYTKPGFFYYNPTDGTRISRQQCQKKKLIKMGYNKNYTAEYICCNILGYYKIYNSGNLKYIKRY